MSVNAARGEVAIQLDGRDFTLRPTYDALAKIEAALNIKTIPLANNIQMRDFGVVDLAVIIFHGMQAAGESEAKLPIVGEMLVKTGILQDDILRAVTDFFIIAINGGIDLDNSPLVDDAGDEDDAGKVDAAAGETTESPSAAT